MNIKINLRKTILPVFMAFTLALSMAPVLPAHAAVGTSVNE